MNKEIFLRMQTMKKINNYIEIKDTNINNTQQTKKFNFVYFLSEGPPHDNGLNLIENKTILEENAKPHFDNIAFYTPRKMIEYGLNNYVKDYKTEGLVTSNPGIYRIGNFAWKAKIILMELEKLSEGDILIYRDSNIKKYGNRLRDYTNIRNIAENCLKICEFDFFIPREHEIMKVEETAKTNIIRELGEDHPFVYSFPILKCNFIVARKTNISMEFFKEWDSACQVEKWIDGEQYGDLHPRFKFSCGDQPILNIIVANWIRKNKHGILQKYPIIGFDNDNIHKIIHFNNYDYLEKLIS